MGYHEMHLRHGLLVVHSDPRGVCGHHGGGHRDLHTFRKATSYCMSSIACCRFVICVHTDINQKSIKGEARRRRGETKASRL